MRNLKRALSLTLASVMLLGMMVVGAGAAGFPDVTEENNVEAIEVLQAVEVMIGDDNGNFGPNDLVNRSQMAVVMANLLNLDYKYYEASCPFWDVPTWARPYVGACYANKIVSGYGDGTYGAADSVTAVQAASMMMRALGYFQYDSDYKDGFETATVRQGTRIGIFKDLTAKSDEPLTRNDVAQMALNALRTPIVEPSDKTINITDGNGNLIASGGQVDYVVVSSKQAYAQTIDRIEQTGNGLNQVTGYTVELGEKLYNGDLQLNDNAQDDFGRPARYWEYDGKAIGTYYKKELMTYEHVGKVTGKDLYDLLGSATIKDYQLNVAIDGVDQDSVNADDAGVFGAESMDKNNKAAVGRTGTGVLTQVFVDNRNAAVNKQGKIYIAIINTYLAKANRDYDEKKEELAITIYGAEKKVSGNYVKNTATDINPVNLAIEDLPIVKDMKSGEFLLVTVAQGDVKTAVAPEILSGVSISGFKRGSDVVVDGQKYEFTTTARYDADTLSKYTSSNTGDINLKDITYNIYLDIYGNLIGVKEIDTVKNYVFITGSDQDSSNYINKTATALGLFVDGTDAVITYKTDKGKPPVEGLHNTWCTYTVDSSGVYTLNMVASKLSGSSNKLAQFATKDAAGGAYNGAFSINSKNSTFNTDDDNIIYGKADTVYLVAERDILTKTTVTGKTVFGAIKGADSTTVDVKKADINVYSKNTAGVKYKGMNPAVTDYSYGVYALYNDGHGIIAAVVVGEDNGSAKKWYWTGNEALLHEDYAPENDETRATFKDGEWTWTRDLFDEDGNKVTLTERGDTSSYLESMNPENWYLIKLNASGEVYRAYRLPGDVEGSAGNLPLVTTEGNVTLFDGSKTAEENKEAEVVTEPTLIGRAVKEGKSHMLVYCDVINNKMNASQNGVLYATTSKDSGFLVTDDTKITLVQYNRNVLETYSDGVGYDYLKSVINQINARHDGKTYDYQISAILDSRVAKSVMILDRVSDWSKPTAPQTGDVILAEGLASGTGKGQVGTVSGTVTTLGGGDTKMSFTLTKPEWAYASADNKNGANVLLRYNILLDGEVWYTGNAAGLYDATTGNSSDDNAGKALTLGSDGKTFTLSNFSLTGNTSLSASEARGKKVTVEITSIDWRYANVEYTLNGKAVEAADGADTFIPTFGPDYNNWSFEVAVACAAEENVAGTATISGVNFYNNAKATVNITSMGASVGSQTVSSWSNGGVVANLKETVVVALATNAGAIKYNVTIGAGSQNTSFGTGYMGFYLSEWFDEKPDGFDQDISQDKANAAFIRLTPATKQVSAGEDLAIEVNSGGNQNLIIRFVGIEGMETGAKVLEAGKTVTFTLANVTKNTIIRTSNIEITPVVKPVITGISLSGNYAAIQFNMPVTLDKSATMNSHDADGKNIGNAYADMVERDFIEDGYVDENDPTILVIKWKNNVDKGGFILPKYSIFAVVKAWGVESSAGYGIKADGSTVNAVVSIDEGGKVTLDDVAVPGIDGFTMPS